MIPPTSAGDGDEADSEVAAARLVAEYELEAFRARSRLRLCGGHVALVALFAARHKPAPLPLATQVDKVKKQQPDNLCAKYLDKKYYAGLEGADRDTFYKCVRTGIDNPDSGMGCYAMTPGGEGRAFEPAAT